MPNEPRTVHCETHGDNRETFVCGHLVEGSKLGFFSAEDDGNPYPDAWCTSCECMRLERGGDWDEKAEAAASVTLICGECYKEIRARNLLES